jgi:hypothetical protein
VQWDNYIRKPRYITYCSNIKCKNKQCERNQIHLPGIEKRGNHLISIAEFKDCEERKN